MTIHYIQHVPFEGLGVIQDWIDQKGFRAKGIKMYESKALPPIQEVSFLIVMGGPMSVYENGEHPWLEKEKTFIRRVIDAQKPVLGICLGAQFIASALGAKVYPGKQKEIGWMPVELMGTFEPFGNSKHLAVLHWHGDTFDLPKGATRIASTEITKNQAFLIGKNVLGLQFHLEMSTQAVQNIIENCRHELEEDIESIQNEKTILAQTSLLQDGSKSKMFETLDYLYTSINSQ